MASIENELMTKFRANSNIIVTGQSHAGKSTFVFSLLKQLHMFESNIRHVLYAYGIWQSLFEQMEKEINHITFYQGIPDKEILEQFTRDYGNIILVLDDVMAQGMNNEDLMSLKKHKTLLRKVVDKKLSNRIKQKIFLRIQRIIPTFLSSVLRYLSSNGKRSGASSKRKISKVT